MDHFWSAPPVSRTITALTFAQSLLVHGGLLRPTYVLFFPTLLVKLLPEAWRLFTPFMLTGSREDFIFDLYFMFKYCSSLETGSPRFSLPGDFFTYLFFVATVILLTAGCLLNNVIFTHALILAFVYTYAQDNRGRKATFFVIQIPIEWLPWVMLTFTIVRNGWSGAVCDGTGIFAAHLYDFLTCLYPKYGGGKNYISTPAFVRRIFTVRERQGEYRSYGTAYQPSNQNQSPSRSWSSVSESSWRGRGQGRRLG